MAVAWLVYDSHQRSDAQSRGQNRRGAHYRNLDSRLLGCSRDKYNKLYYFLFFAGGKLKYSYGKSANHWPNSCIGFPHGLALFVKKTVWQKLDGYDENLIFGGDDNDLGIKSWLLGYKNYLYSQSSQIHLGEAERRDNNKYAIKFKEIFYAHLYTIVKNFTFINLWPALIGQIVFMFFKSIKQSIFRFYFGPFFAFGQGLILFFKKIPIACQKRKEIQIKRKEKRDVFLKIKPQKIKK